MDQMSRCNKVLFLPLQIKPAERRQFSSSNPVTLIKFLEFFLLRTTWQMSIYYLLFGQYNARQFLCAQFYFRYDSRSSMNEWEILSAEKQEKWDYYSYTPLSSNTSLHGFILNLLCAIQCTNEWNGAVCLQKQKTNENIALLFYLSRVAHFVGF